MIIIAVVCAAVFGWLLWPVRVPLSRLQPEEPAAGGRWARLLPAAVVVLIGAVVVISSGYGSLLLQGATICVVIAMIVLTVWGRRRDRAALRRRSAVAEAAQVLAQSLHSGAITEQALAAAALECPVLEPAAAASRVGADPVRVMFAGSRQPGAAGMAELARGWSLIIRSGVPAGPLLQRLATSVAAEEEVAAELQTELAASRFTGRLLAALPLAGLLIGFVVGGDPIAFLLDTLVGQVCLFLGVVLAAAGVFWGERIAARSGPVPQLPSEPSMTTG